MRFRCARLRRGMGASCEQDLARRPCWTRPSGGATRVPRRGQTIAKGQHTLALWKATLTCGHQFTTLMALDWTPEQGLAAAPSRSGWPRCAWSGAEAQDARPDPRRVRPDNWTRDGRSCTTTSTAMCASNVRKPVAYQPLGWLVPPPPGPRQAAHAERHLRSACARNWRRPSARPSGCAPSWRDWSSRGEPMPGISA